MVKSMDTNFLIWRVIESVFSFLPIKAPKMYRYYLKIGRKLFIEWICKYYHATAYFYFLKIVYPLLFSKTTYYSCFANMTLFFTVENQLACLMNFAWCSLECVFFFPAHFHFSFILEAYYSVWWSLVVYFMLALKLIGHSMCFGGAFGWVLY